MTLRPIDASGSQRFEIAPQFAAQDVRHLVSPPAISPLGPAFAPPEFTRAVRIPGTKDLFFGSVTLTEGRAGTLQEGTLWEGYGSVASGSCVCDQPGFLRLPIMTVSQATPNPAGQPFRMVHARFQGVEVIGMYDQSGTPKLFRETSATDPTIIEVPGYTANGAAFLMCMGVISSNGTDYLALGYANKGGATSTLQLIADITNAAVSVYGNTGATSVWGFTQLPDGSLMIYRGNKITMVDPTVTAPAAWLLTDTSTVNPGGYMVGLHALGGGVPSVYVATRQPPHTGFYFDPADPGSAKHDLMAVSLDGYTVQKIDTGLPWVTFVNKVRDGLMYCNQETHIYNNGRRFTPTDWLNGRPPSPLYRFKCRGHYTDEMRFWWSVNYYGAGQNTEAWWEEFDFDTQKSLPVSQPVVLGTSQQSVAGWDLPYSANTRNLHRYDAGTGRWYHQEQRIPKVPGYDLRRLPNGTAGTGAQFEATDEHIKPIITDYPGLEGCPCITVWIKGPPNRHIAQGENATFDGTTHAYVEAGESLSGVSAVFHQRGPAERRPEKPFPRNRSWSHGFKPYVRLGRQTGGSDPTRLTVNGFPVTYGLIFYKDGGANIVPAQYRSMDATALLRRLG